eukprot:c27483_g1_i1 orf=336-2381(-)
MGSWSIHGNAEISARYEILGRIGSGTYADVYKARRRDDGRIVALKEVHDYQSSCREIDALVRLGDHPHIIKLFEYIWHGEDAVLVLEYLPSSLAAVIRKGQKRESNHLTDAEVKGWMLQLLQGLVACHAANLLHRDLKPSNMLISSEGVLKLADFGQARSLDDGSGSPNSVPNLAERNVELAIGEMDISEGGREFSGSSGYGSYDLAEDPKSAWELWEKNGGYDEDVCPLELDYQKMNSGLFQQVQDIKANEKEPTDSKVARLMESHKNNLDVCSAIGDRSITVCDSSLTQTHVQNNKSVSLEDDLLIESGEQSSYVRLPESADEVSAQKHPKLTIRDDFQGNEDGLPSIIPEHSVECERKYHESATGSENNKIVNNSFQNNATLTEDKVQVCEYLGTDRSFAETNYKEQEALRLGNFSDVADEYRDIRQQEYESISWVKADAERGWESRLDRAMQEWDSGSEKRFCSLEGTSGRSEEELVGEEIDVYGEAARCGFTGCVGTRWYRAPELLYGATRYGMEMDMWAVGCIFGELLMGQPVFPGISDIDQLSRVVRVLGNPTEECWPGVSQLPDFGKISFVDDHRSLSLQQHILEGSEEAHSLLEKLITYDPASRITALAALHHEYFMVEPLPAAAGDLEVPSPDIEDDDLSETWKEQENSWSSSDRGEGDIFFSFANDTSVY